MVELAEIFRRYGAAYRAKYGPRLLPSHRRALWDIERCRTPALGGHLYTCPDCGTEEYRYHSCRNRHGPKCQHDKAEQWLAAQQDLLLPVPYFLLTFTLPEALRRIARSHQRLCYDLLFRVAAEATQQLGQNGRWVGGQMGMLGVLHTWGRNLAYHPHVHFLVPGGGVDQTGMWHPARSSFLLPVKALSRLMRAKFRDGLCRADAAVGAQVPQSVWQQAWVVHCQPVGIGTNAVKYLAAYVFRVAISNRRFVKLENDQVTFRYRETGSGKLKYCTLPAEVFIHRFLQHVLPRRLVKVRDYGFLAPCQRQRLRRLRQQLLCAAGTAAPDPVEAEVSSCSRRPYEVRCPACQQVMQRGARIQPTGHNPPGVSGVGKTRGDF